MDLLQSVDPTSSSNSGSDAYRPSFFELAAQEQLRDLLKPALRYVLAVLAQRNPRYLLRIVNRFDEVYALCMFMVERHYLKTWGSSFAENFYGLRRRRRPGLSAPRSKAFSASSTRTSLARYETLRPREINASLFLLVAAPYLKSKLDDLWEKVGGGLEAEEDMFGDEEVTDEAGQEGSRRAFNDSTAISRREQVQQLATKCFRKGYPYLGAVSQLWLLSYNVAYLFDRTPYWRPWLQAMRVDIRRVGAEDYPPSPPLLPPDMPNPLRSPVAFALRLMRASPFIFFEALKYALPASIFFFKFLEWWYSSDNPRRRRGGGSGGGVGDTTGLPLFPGPKPLLPHPKGVVFVKHPKWRDPQVAATRLAPLKRIGQDGREELQAQSGLLHNSCPICGAAPIANPCLLPSGYGACFTCANEYVEENQRCPVTLMPMPGGTKELRRVLG